MRCEILHDTILLLQRGERGREGNFRCTMAVQIEFARWQFHCTAVYHPRETAISISLCATNIISLRRMIDRSCPFVKRRWLAHIQLLFTAAAAIDDRLRMKECPQKNDTLRQCNMSLFLLHHVTYQELKYDTANHFYAAILKYTARF